MSNFQVRTDLALEARESISDVDSELRGVRVEEYYNEADDIRVTKVMIDTKNGAKAMGKPIGTYVTMEAPAMVEPDEDYHREISECLSEELQQMIPDSDKEQSILVVGLGNREVTADSLGPQVVDNLFITRHGGPIGAGIISTIFGLLAAGAAIICSLCIAGIGLLVAGASIFAAAIGCLAVTPPVGILLLGGSFVIIGVGILLMILGIWIVTKVVPPVIRWFVAKVRGIFYKKEV